MQVSEGAAPSGAGWEKDIGSLALDTDVYPLIRIRCRGRSDAPQFMVDVEYTDASMTSSGWVNAPVGMDAYTMGLTRGKTVHKVKLYAKSNQANGTAEIDYDYAVIQSQFPIVPFEHKEVDVDLAHTVETGGFRVRSHHDKLHGVTGFRYSFDEDVGDVATDLGPAKLNGVLKNTPTWVAGAWGYALQFASASSGRVDTGYTYTVPAAGATTLLCWVKIPAGETGVVMGSGKAPGGVFNRLQLDLQTPNIRVYAKDDAANVRSYTSTATVLDDTWHMVAAVVDPANDVVQLYVDGAYDGQTTGALGVITLDSFDVTIGCLHNEGGYSGYIDGCVDEPAIYTRRLSAAEIAELYSRQPRSGVSRVHTGAWCMIYLAGKGEAMVDKILCGRIIDREYGGDSDEPWVEHTGEDQAEILQDRTWARSFTSLTQISAVADYVIDDACDELYKDTDTTNRTIRNKFKNEVPFNVLQKLAASASYATGELGANVFVDPGGCFRFKKLGAFTCGEHVSDGSDGHDPNILDIKVTETIKGTPKMANDVKLVIFEDECIPADEDGYTEGVEDWSAPDPTDAGYPESDFDRVEGLCSVKYQTTNPGTLYRMRLQLSQVDLAGFDELRFYIKYGAGLSVDLGFLAKLLKGDYASPSYMSKVFVAPGAAVWHEVVVDLTAMGRTGSIGSVVDRLEIAARDSTEVGAGGFLIDKLRFVRNEKSVTSGDAASQAEYGKRTLQILDKNISDLAWAQYVADNIVANRKHPIAVVYARVDGQAQLGYRPPQKVLVTSLKDGLSSKYFQIVRAKHRMTVGERYYVDLDLIAAKMSISPPDYDAIVGPALNDWQALWDEWLKHEHTTPWYSARSQWS